MTLKMVFFTKMDDYKRDLLYYAFDKNGENSLQKQTSPQRAGGASNPSQKDPPTYHTKLP